jgi:hypothetical protein
MKGKGYVAFVVALMAASIIFGAISVAYTYDYGWRVNFAEKHLNVAQSVTDAESQYVEISRAIEILQVFPKEGNYFILNKNDPLTNMTITWMSLYQLQGYANEIRKMDRNSSSYQIGIYNSQEKISYFKENLWESFETFITWGANGWLAYLAASLGIFGFMAGLIVASPYEHKVDYQGRSIIFRTFFLTLIALIVFFIIAGIPLFYTGPV